jgi:hypothetical protein
VRGTNIRAIRNGLSDKGLGEGAVILIPVTEDGNGKLVLQAAFPDSDPFAGNRPSMRIPRPQKKIRERNLSPGMVFIAIVQGIRPTREEIPIRKEKRRKVYIILSTLERYTDVRFQKRKGGWKIFPGTDSDIASTSVRITNEMSYRRYPKNAVIETEQVFANGKLLRESHTIYRAADLDQFKHLQPVSRSTFHNIRDASFRKKWKKIPDDALLEKIRAHT